MLLLLRTQLQRAQKSRGRSATAATGKTTRQGALERVQHIAGADTLTNAELARVLIAGLLEDELGSALANTPQFQQLADDVRRLIEGDERGRRLLANASRQLVGKFE